MKFSLTGKACLPIPNDRVVVKRQSLASKSHASKKLIQYGTPKVDSYTYTNTEHGAEIVLDYDDDDQSKRIVYVQNLLENVGEVRDSNMMLSQIAKKVGNGKIILSDYAMPSRRY